MASAPVSTGGLAAGTRGLGLSKPIPPLGSALGTLKPASSGRFNFGQQQQIPHGQRSGVVASASGDLTKDASSAGDGAPTMLSPVQSRELRPAATPRVRVADSASIDGVDMLLVAARGQIHRLLDADAQADNRYGTVRRPGCGPDCNPASSLITMPHFARTQNGLDRGV